MDEIRAAVLLLMAKQVRFGGVYYSGAVVRNGAALAIEVGDPCPR